MAEKKRKEKIIQFFRSETLGDVVLTDRGNIFRVQYISGLDKKSGVVFFENEMKLIKIKNPLKP